MRCETLSLRRTPPRSLCADVAPPSGGVSSFIPSASIVRVGAVQVQKTWAVLGAKPAISSPGPRRGFVVNEAVGGRNGVSRSAHPAKPAPNGGSHRHPAREIERDFSPGSYMERVAAGEALRCDRRYQAAVPRLRKRRVRRQEVVR